MATGSWAIRPLLISGVNPSAAWAAGGGIIGLDIAMKHPERLDHLFAQAANITTDGVDPAVATNAVTLYKVLGGGAQAPDGRG